MEPLVIVSAGLVSYFIYLTVVQALKDLRREKGRHSLSMPVPVEVHCRKHAYRESYMTTRDRW